MQGEGGHGKVRRRWSFGEGIFLAVLIYLYGDSVDPREDPFNPPQAITAGVGGGTWPGIGMFGPGRPARRRDLRGGRRPDGSSAPTPQSDSGDGDRMLLGGSDVAVATSCVEDDP